MPFLDFLFRRRATSRGAEADRPQSANPQTTVSSVTRKDLLRVVLREALFRNGIPAAWLAPEVLRTVHRGRDSGLHMRLVLRHWDPRLLQHAPSLERDVLARLQLLDPSAQNWFAGFSWQFGLADAEDLPPLPHPGTWTAPPPAMNLRRRAAPDTEPGADVIAGPLVIKPQAQDARADLERLLALRDEDLRRHAQDGDAFARTRPLTL